MRLFVVLLVLVGLGVAEELPFDFQYRESTPIGSVEEEVYDRMEPILIDEKGDRYDSVVYGHSWKIDYEIPKDLRSRDTRDAIIAQIAETIGQKTYDPRARYFQTLLDERIYWIYVNIIYNRYSVRVLREGGYAPIMVIKSDQPYRYNERLTRLNWKIPRHDLIPNIDGFAFSLASYKRLDRQTFKWNDEGKKNFKTVKGATWHVKYEFEGDPADKTIRRYRMLHNYRDIIELGGGSLEYEATNRILFKMGENALTIWGEFGCSDTAAELTLVESSAQESGSLISAEGLKYHLDRTGRVILTGIYFDTGAARLKERSMRSIIAASVMMKRYPDIRIEVQGHTDSTGSAEVNQKLSDARAESVKQALISNGIDGDRIRTKGYGNTRPITKGTSEEIRKKNRRVELHHLTGGEKRVTIDASFFQPLRDAEPVDMKEEPYDTLYFPYMPPYVTKEKARQVSGPASQVRYILLKNGARDRSVSAYEIMTTFEEIIGAYSGKITAKRDDQFYFMIRKGAGDKSVYGYIEAQTGAYRIYTITAEQIVDPNAKKKKKKKEQN